MQRFCFAAALIVLEFKHAFGEHRHCCCIDRQNGEDAPPPTLFDLAVHAPLIIPFYLSRTIVCIQDQMIVAGVKNAPFWRQ
jgi:hypothetical protein